MGSLGENGLSMWLQRKMDQFFHCGHNGGSLPSQGAAPTGNGQGNPRACGLCSPGADETLHGDCVGWRRLAEGMWSNGLIRAPVSPLSPHSRWARPLASLLPVRSTWDGNQENRMFPETPAQPCHHPLPGSCLQPCPECNSTSSGERSPGHLLKEDLEPP